MERVQKCGFDLFESTAVPEGEPASEKDYAAVDWEAWKVPEGEPPEYCWPDNDLLRNCGVQARVAYRIMLKSKSEMVDFHGELEHETVDEMMAGLCQAEEHLKFLAHMIETATVRVIAGAPARKAAGKPFKYGESEAT